jgi:hypothetical protein
VPDIDRIAGMPVVAEHRPTHNDVGLVGGEIRIVGDEDVARLRLGEFGDDRLHGTD